MQKLRIMNQHLQRRIQFMESLCLLASYRELITTNRQSMKKQHHNLQQSETHMVENLIPCLHINDNFRKQFQKISRSAFSYISQSSHYALLKNSSKYQTTGTIKEIIREYINFFKQVNEQHLVKFLGELFQLNTYTHASVIYVLLGILFKFLRVKCEGLINNCLPSPNKKQSTNTSSRNEIKSKRTSTERSKGKPFARKNTEQKSRTIERSTMFSECYTIGGIKRQRKSYGPRVHTEILSSPSPKHKRRIVHSFKRLDSPQKQKSSLVVRASISPTKPLWYNNQETYLKSFLNAYSQQWAEYFSSLPDDTFQMMGKTESSTGRYKLKWLQKNYERMINEVLWRNNEIRKGIQCYSQHFHA